MKVPFTFRLVIFAFFLAALFGCDSKNVVTSDQKKGSNAAARADKKGDG